MLIEIICINRKNGWIVKTAFARAHLLGKLFVWWIALLAVESALSAAAVFAIGENKRRTCKMEHPEQNVEQYFLCCCVFVCYKLQYRYTNEPTERKKNHLHFHHYDIISSWVGFSFLYFIHDLFVCSNDSKQLKIVQCTSTSTKQDAAESIQMVLLLFFLSFSKQLWLEGK